MSRLNLAAAARIGSLLVREALWYQDRCNWIGSVTRNPGRRPGTTFGTHGAGIYEGSAGIGWFLAHLYRNTGERDFSRVARGALLHSLRESNPDEAVMLSMYRGALGVVVLALDVASILHDDVIRGRALALLRQLTTTPSRFVERDLLSGMAGSIVCLVILAAQTRDDHLLELAISIANRLMRPPRRHRARSSAGNRLGFSHGAAGTAYALLELFGAVNDPRLLKAATDLLAVKGTVLRRTKERSALESTSWCNGRPGIALARMRAFEISGFGPGELRSVLPSIRSIVEDELQNGDSMCLCHGLAGNAAVLHEIPTSLNGGAARRDTMLAQRAALHCARRLPPHVFSLFLGAAGIGYVNLRLHDPTVPSILLLRREHFAPGPSLTTAAGTSARSASDRTADPH